MPTPNDIFSVLGKVEVDLQALRASLSNAEALVQASTNRQAKSYEDFANRAKRAAHDAAMASATHRASANEPYEEGAYAQKFGSGGGVGAGGGAVEHANKVAEGFKKVHEHGVTSIGTLRGFSHIINTMIPGLGGTASGLLQITRHMGVAGAAVLVAASAFAIFASRVAEAAKLNYEIQRSMATRDFERLDAALGAANEDLAVQTDLVQRSVKSWTSWGNVVDSYVAGGTTLINDILGKGVDAAAEKAGKLAEAWGKANTTFGQAAKENQANTLALLAFNEQQARFGVQQAETVINLTRWYKVLDEIQSENTATLKAQIAEQWKDYAAKKGLVEGTKAYAEAYAPYAEKIRLVDDKLRDAQYHNSLEQKKRLVEMAQAEAEHTKKLEAEYQKRTQSTLRLRKTEIQVTEEIAQATAKAQGFVASGGKAIEDTYRVEREAIESAEAASVSAYEQDSKILKKKISDHVDFEASKKALSELDTARETASIETVNKIRELGLTREKDQLLNAERMRTETIAKNIRNTETYFGLRKSMGYDTIQGEIAAQKQLNQAYKQGTDEYYNGQKKVYDLQKQARDEAKSSVQGIVGQAAESLKKKTGRKAFTLSELQKEAGVIKTGDEKLFGEASGGRAVDTDLLLKGLGRQAGFEKFEAQGGNLSALFDRAITPQFRGFAEGVESATDALSLFKQALIASREAADARAASQSADNQYLRDPSMNQMSESQGRQRLLESRRGPADNPSVS